MREKSHMHRRQGGRNIETCLLKPPTNRREERLVNTVDLKLIYMQMSQKYFSASVCRQPQQQLN